MAENTHPLIPYKDKAPAEEVTPDWDQVLYAPQRVDKWLQGEITPQELNAVSGPEMLEMAVIGFSMYEQGRYQEAKVVFQGLCTLDPGEGYYRTALGAVYLAEDELDAALRALNEAIDLNEKEIASWVNRGEVFLRQGKIIEAAQDFKRAVDLDPENKDPLSHRARILAGAALETMEQAQRFAHNPEVAKPAPKPGAKAPKTASSAAKKK